MSAIVLRPARRTFGARVLDAIDRALPPAPPIAELREPERYVEAEPVRGITWRHVWSPLVLAAAVLRWAVRWFNREVVREGWQRAWWVSVFPVVALMAWALGALR